MTSKSVFDAPAPMSISASPIKGERIEIRSAAGSFPAYVARPRRRHAPSIVVAHDVLGINEDVRWICNHLADQGYVAVCPDLFWRQERGIGLSGRSALDLELAAQLHASFDATDGVSDIVAAVRTARTISGTSEKVGMLGHGMGGLLAFLVSARIGLDAAVAYDGRDIERHLAEAALVQSPLMLHLAQDDHVAGGDAKRAVGDALADHPWVELHVHAGARRGFTRRTAPTFDASSAERADRLDLALFDKYLRFNNLDNPSERT